MEFLVFMKGISIASRSSNAIFLLGTDDGMFGGSTVHNILYC